MGIELFVVLISYPLNVYGISNYPLLFLVLVICVFFFSSNLRKSYQYSDFFQRTSSYFHCVLRGGGWAGRGCCKVEIYLVWSPLSFLDLLSFSLSLLSGAPVMCVTPLVTVPQFWNLLICLLLLLLLFHLISLWILVWEIPIDLSSY